MSKQNNLKPILISLAYISLLAIIMLIIRMFFIRDYVFSFIAWNLFLAWIPLLLAYYLYFFTIKRGTYLQAIIFILWLIFLPNAPYLLTDFIHLSTWYRVPLWYDMILFFTFAWIGLSLGAISLFLVEKFLKKSTPARMTAILINFIIILSGFGIYFGRFMRWNSWDIFLHPILVMGDLANAILTPKIFFDVLGFTITWSLFIMGSYYFFKKLLANLKI